MTGSGRGALRVGVVGAGVMGADHIARLTHTTAGASVTAVVEPDRGRAEAAVALAPGSVAYPSLDAALDAGALDAVVIATPGRFHEEAILTALAAGLPTLCEKPLTEDSASALRLVEAEAAVGRRLVQVGFMRRFDREYRAIAELVRTGRLGELLTMHCAHRAESVPPSFSHEMRITDSAAHEFDIVPWIARADIRSIRAFIGRTTSLSGEGVREPILLLLELTSGVLVDLEINLSSGFGYQVTTEAVFERGIVRAGAPSGIQTWSDGHVSRDEHRLFTGRFREAYDDEFQRWVEAARDGGADGPSIWDGYRVAVACEAGLAALEADGAPCFVELPPVPGIYVSA